MSADNSGADRAIDVAIVGGGFGAISAALVLEKELANGWPATVTLISDRGDFSFTPLVPEVAASLISYQHVVTPIRRMFTHVKFFKGQVHRIDPVTKQASFVDTDDEPQTLAYRHCLLAIGSVAEFFDIPGLAENALTLKTPDDAIRIRHQILDVIERASLRPAQERRGLLTFAVVGGGLNGTELTGELHDFIRAAVRDYPAIRTEEVRVILVEMLDRLAQELPAELSRYALENLKGRGIEVRLNSRVIAYKHGNLTLADGQEIATATLIWTAGAGPAPLTSSLQVSRANPSDRRLPVNEYLQVDNHTDLWAIGDCALVPDPAGGFQPPTAQHAVRQGRHAAGNLIARIRGRPASPYQYRGIGMLASLGRFRGVGQVFGIRLTGFIAWFAWRSYYLFALPRWDRRLRVALDWALNLVFPPDIVGIGQFRRRHAEFAPPKENAHAACKTS